MPISLVFSVVCFASILAQSTVRVRVRMLGLGLGLGLGCFASILAQSIASLTMLVNLTAFKIHGSFELIKCHLAAWEISCASFRVPLEERPAIHLRQCF